jgi:hypothetical protein
MATTALFRPVGPKEFKLIQESDWSRFPPRLPEQPIFYPVLQEEYARKIARDWNVKDSGAGFVMRFEIDRSYMDKFEKHEVGGRACQEYWIPADELGIFNSQICGRIRLIAEFSDQGEPIDWVSAYDLEEDEQTIALVQRATLETEEFGLLPDVALYGSKAWWKAIEDGRIKKHEVRGKIVRLPMSGLGDWPEFELENANGRSRWTRLGDQAMYKEGKDVRLEYVDQKRRKPWLGKESQKEILRIFIER